MSLQRWACDGKKENTQKTLKGYCVTSAYVGQGFIGAGQSSTSRNGNRQMVPHNYLNASENIAQYQADQIDRQEVTVDWYLDHMIDACVFRWTSDEDAGMGLDPWRFYMDLPIEPEDVAARGWRLFVQRKDMPAELQTEKHVPFPPFVWPDTCSEAKLQDAADQRWNSQ